MKKLFACQTPGCSAGCAYAWNCHNRRIGAFSVNWAVVGLGILLILGIFAF